MPQAPGSDPTARIKGLIGFASRGVKFYGMTRRKEKSDQMSDAWIHITFFEKFNLRFREPGLEEIK
jgi:hypothetical protein